MILLKGKFVIEIKLVVVNGWEWIRGIDYRKVIKEFYGEMKIFYILIVVDFCDFIYLLKIIEIYS